MIAERPVYFPSGGETLFGVLAQPTDRGDDDVAALVLGEGTMGGIRGQGGTLVRLARAITQGGCSSLRFDYAGVGDSSGAPPDMRRDEPFPRDVDAAIEWLGTCGYRRFVLVGSCIGAQTALVAASERSDVVAAALLSCVVSSSEDDVRATSDLTLRAAASAAQRGVDLFFLFGRGDRAYAEFEVARADGLRACLDAPTTSVEVLDGKIHSFVQVELQATVIDLVVSWAGRATTGARNGDRRAALQRASAQPTP